MTNPSQSPVSAQLLVSRPGLPQLCDEPLRPSPLGSGSRLPKLCSKPLKTSPFESFRDPVTGRWINYLPDCQNHHQNHRQMEAIASAQSAIQLSEQLSEQPSEQPSTQAAPASTSEPKPMVSLGDRLFLALRSELLKYLVLKKFRLLGKFAVSVLRASGIGRSIRKIFTTFWVLAR